MAGTPWNKVAIGALAAVAAVALLMVVTDPATRTRPEPPRLLAGGSLWTKPGTVSVTPGSPGVRDGLALIQHEGLRLVDVTTGDNRWTVDAGARLAGSSEVYSSGGTLVGAGVLVRTRTGIALLSRDDGSVRWRAPVRARAGERYVLVAADDRTALVTVGPTRGGAPRVIALETATGQERWRYEGLSPYTTAGNVVVGVTAYGTIAAVYLDRGVEAWSLTDLAPARVVLTAGDAVLVEGGTGAGRPHRRVVAADTGDVLAELGSVPRTGPCATDGATLMACPLARGPAEFVFETYDVAARQVRTVSGGYQPRSVCLVGPKHLFGAGPDAYFAVDRRGGLAASRLPGRPVAVSGDYLVVRTEGGDTPLTSVYRMRN